MLALIPQNQAGQRFIAFGYQQNYQHPPCPLLTQKPTSFVPIVVSAFDPKRTLALWHPRHAHAASEAHAAREKGRIVARSEGAEATEGKARVER
jgi:hypothetical protein